MPPLASERGAHFVLGAREQVQSKNEQKDTLVFYLAISHRISPSLLFLPPSRTFCPASPRSPSLHHLYFCSPSASFSLAVCLPHVHIICNNKSVQPERAHGHAAGPLLLTVGCGWRPKAGGLDLWGRHLRPPGVGGVGAFPPPFPGAARPLLNPVSFPACTVRPLIPWPPSLCPPGSVPTVTSQPTVPPGTAGTSGNHRCQGGWGSMDQSGRNPCCMGKCHGRLSPWPVTLGRLPPSSSAPRTCQGY